MAEVLFCTNCTKYILNRQAQDKMMILNQKRIQATVAFDDGTDALHANAVTRFIGYRNSIFKWNVIPAGVFHL